MTFLPLVERELRVTSRRKSTFWIRCGAVLLGIFVLLVALTSAADSPGYSSAGAAAFSLMSWLTAVGCALSGVFLAADCIAKERRDGTLGLMFLTDLSSFDVVAGKFVGVSLNAFYGTLAMMPLLGASILAGGVTEDEFWRTTLALLNLLFFSTCLSIFISARVKSNSAPTMLALGLMAGIWIGGAVARLISDRIPWLQTGHILFCLSLVSPGETFSLAPAASYLSHASSFWISLAISNSLGWLCFGLAAWKLGHSIEDPEKAAFRARKPRQRELLNSAPIAWLLDDSLATRIGVWTLALIGVAITLLCSWKGPTLKLGWALIPIYLLLKIRFAISACRFFAEGRQSGALELLRTTPMGGAEMISQQWKSWRRVYAGPVCMLAAAHATAGFWSVKLDESIFYVLVDLCLAISNCVDFYAIGWFGLWISLTARKPDRAQMFTIIFMVIIPALLCVPNLLIAAISILILPDRVRRRLNAFLAVRNLESRDEWTMVRS